MPAKPVEKLCALIALAMSLFHLYAAFAGPPDAMVFRALHLAFALVLGFLTLQSPGRGEDDGPGWHGILLAVLALSAALYPVFMADYINNRMYYVDDLLTADWVFGSVMIVLLLEGTRRAVGLALPLTAVCFLVYAVVFGNVSLAMLMEQMFITTEGIYGIPISVSATYVVLFILFGSLVERSGAGKLFMDFALALTGRSAGGPAKVACVTSGLFGTVSGSAVANVMTTGAFSIPLMKRIGYKAGFAGAVEAVASTGGQIMPPIMGAAAFIMAEFLGISYLKVAAFALIPAVLYYLAVFMSVHFEAKRIGLEGLAAEDCPKLGEVLSTRGHLFLPLIIVIGVLLYGYSAPFAALCGIISVMPTVWLRKSTRNDMPPRLVVEGLIAGARNTVTVALACGCAGIVIGVITLTGLGIDFTGLVIAVSRDSLVIALILTMCAGIILGMGMPTAPAYIVQVALLVPAVVKLGVPVEAAHMFVFYFAILSAITPPVALAVYAANGISRATLWEGSSAALKLGATGYIIPFMFVYGPALLMIGDWTTIVLACFTAIIGVVSLSAALMGYALAPLVWWQRLLLAMGAITLIKTGLMTDVLGIVLILLALLPSLSGRFSREVRADGGTS